MKIPVESLGNSLSGLYPPGLIIRPFRQNMAIAIASFFPSPYKIIL